MCISKIVLGSAQFSMRYGISNGGVRLAKHEVFEIINFARVSGIEKIDTAVTYGDSELLLGNIGVNSFNVITKIPPFCDEDSNPEAHIRNIIVDSLNKLRIKKIYGVLLHKPSDLIGVNGDLIYRALCRLRSEGLIDKIGISIYSPEELDFIYPHFDLDIVQAPINPIDTRLLNSKWLNTLHKDGVEIHARSIFLQGLLLMDANERPIFFNKWKELLAWDEWIQSTGFEKLNACIKFIKAKDSINNIIIGVNSINHLKQVVLAFSDESEMEFLNIPSSNSVFLNPGNWPP